MSISKYTPAEYQNWVQASSNRHLLVEGRDDKRAFEMLMRCFIGNDWKDDLDIDIDTAADLISGNEAHYSRNCDNVEFISRNISNSEYAERFVGFVDREFRAFCWDDEFVDHIDRHNIVERLVWSRGHSIENYCFDISILRDPLIDLSISEHFGEALNLFRDVFDSAIRLACAVSLVGLECDNLQIVGGSIDWHSINICEDKVNLCIDNWRQVLTQKNRLPEDRSGLIIDLYQKWISNVQEADVYVIRWMCHGHIGLKVLWEVYARCIYVVCENLDPRQRASETTRVLSADMRVRFNACVGSWCRHSLNSNCEYPRDVFILLGVEVPKS